MREYSVHLNVVKKHGLPSQQERRIATQEEGKATYHPQRACGPQRYLIASIRKLTFGLRTPHVVILGEEPLGAMLGRVFQLGKTGPIRIGV